MWRDVSERNRDRGNMRMGVGCCLQCSWDGCREIVVYIRGDILGVLKGFLWRSRRGGRQGKCR